MGEANRAFAGGAVGISSIWLIRNVIQTGQPLGPRFSGGAVEPLTRTVRLALSGTGHIVVGDGWSDTALIRIGTIVVVGVVVLLALALYTREAVVLDLGMITFVLTSFVVPRRPQNTANDIELRVISPILIP